MYLFIFLTLCMFRAHRAHHQERQIVSIQPLVAVTLCRWPCRVQVGSGWFGGVAAAHRTNQSLSFKTLNSDTFLVNDQRDAQLFSMYLFIFLTLYMFRAHRAHHQERHIVSIQPLVDVNLCLCRVQVGSEVPTCTRHILW